MSYRLERRQFVALPLADTFAFHAEPRNLARITPGWLAFRLLGFDVADGNGGETAHIQMRKGLRLEYRIRPLGVPQRWTSEITEWDPPRRFVDEQLRGPYRSWRHEHEFRAVAGGTEIVDRVSYALPLGALGRLAHALFVRRQLRAIFDHREAMVERILVQDSTGEGK
jgi:ligand-binding SRPBCC domain-containing protein